MKTKNLVIRASAGTGKTFALATRFLQLALFNKVPPERIVALTFSRNAAQEIYVAILKRLWTAAGGDETKKLSPEETSALERKMLLEGLFGKDLEEARRVDCSPDAFARLLRAVVGVQDAGAIATLDSFILRVVRSFPFETGFDEVPDVLDGFGNNRVAADAFSAVLSGDGSLISVPILVRGGEHEYVLVDATPRHEVLDGWLSFVSAIEREGAPAFGDVSIEDAADLLVPLMIAGSRCRALILDYTGEVALPDAGSVATVPFDGVPCVLAHLPVPFTDAWIVFCPTSFAVSLFRSFLFIKAVERIIVYFFNLLIRLAFLRNQSICIRRLRKRSQSCGLCQSELIHRL